MAKEGVFPGGAKTRTGPSGTGISPNVSLNYSVAKVIAILTVAAGHWFAGSLLWIPVTFGLFVFAFSSAYFITKIYGDRANPGKFWLRKLERLGLRYWVILAFLAVLLAAQGKTVLHWHSLVHLLGLSGALNWMQIWNQSGLGAGLWFFTLLLLFYLAYPYLFLVARLKPAIVVAVSLFATVGAIYLEHHMSLGHELYLTALGFVLGVMYGAHEPRISAWLAGLMALLSCAALVVLNAYLHYKGANTALIALASIGIALWLSTAGLPQWAITRKIARLEAYLLEIFMIHVYLFIRPTGNSLLDFVISMGLVVAAAVAIHRIAGFLSALVFDRPVLAPAPQDA